MNLTVQSYHLSPGKNTIALPYGAKLLEVIENQGEFYLLALVEIGQSKISEVDIYAVRSTQKFAGQISDEYLGSVIRKVGGLESYVYSFFRSIPVMKFDSEEL